VPESLRRTWAALAVAALAVLVIALLAGRDFVHDVVPECAGSVVIEPFSTNETPDLLPVALDGESPFQLRFDQKSEAWLRHGAGPEYLNVRIEWSSFDSDDRPCTCGAIPIRLSGEAPSDLHLYRLAGSNQYVVKGRWANTEQYYTASTDYRVAFVNTSTPSRHLATDRIFTRQRLPGLIALLAIGALGVGLLRSRRATAYALRTHAWTEARLTPEGLLEADSGGTLGTLEQSHATRVAPGPVLVAPAALSSSGLYRDMPIVPRRSIVEGTHARWSAATMQRLRDARALAVISTTCTLVAFGARLIA
jgi:hypothetical protein